MATAGTGTFNANLNTRNESSAIITSGSSSSTTVTHSTNTVTSNTVGRDQHNYTYQTNYIFNPPQNRPTGSGSSSEIVPSHSFNDAPLGLLSANFSGRQEELVQILESFEVVRGDVPTRFGLYAGPGFGKSQLALALAKEAFTRGRYKYIFWFPATTVEKLYQGFSKLLHIVGHPDRSDSEELVKLMAARRWLEDFNSGRWLLVLDNVVWETVNFLREHLPQTNNQGNILFTTRTKEVATALAHTPGDQHEILELGLPNEEEAARLLLGHFENGKIAGDESKVNEIVKSVGCLPLAIAQAAAYMRQTGSTLDGLLTIYKSEHKIDMMEWQNELSIYQEKSVAATFMYQLDDLQRQFPDVRNLLKILAYFDPESIPLDMLITGASILSKSRQHTASDSVAPFPQKRISFIGKVKNKLRQPYEGKGKGSSEDPSSVHTMSAAMSSLLALIQSPMGLPNAIAQLQNRSLTKQQGTGQSSSLWMHDLTRTIILDNTKKTGAEREWFENAVVLACSAFEQIPDPKLPESWPRCETLIPHIQSLTIRQDISDDSNHSLLVANHRIAGYLSSRGRYNDAEVLYKQVLLSLEKQLGPEHVDTLTTKHNLAIVYQSQGRYSDAEMYKQVLSSQEKQLDPEHVDTLITKHNLADVYESQGRYDDAEVLYKQVLSSQEKQLGTEHVSTLSTKHNMAFVYKSQGRFNDAEVLFKQVLLSQEKQLGPEHVNTLITKGNLANIYKSQGRFSDAEVLFKQVLFSQEKQLGLEHVNTLITKGNLAKVYGLQERYSDAEMLFKQVLLSQEKQLGPEHVSTLITKHNLADVYESQGRYSDAETLYKEVLLSKEKRLDPEHVGTLTTRHNLAFVYKSQGRYTEAESLLLHVLAGRERQLGLSHPHTHATQLTLADVYMKQGRLDEAAKMSSSVSSLAL